MKGGHCYNKYESTNPIERRMVAGFLRALQDLVRGVGPEIRSITDAGCGEGYVAKTIAGMNIGPVLAFDAFEDVVGMAARTNAASGVTYYTRLLEEARPEVDGADLVVCLEVLEHLDDPAAAMQRLVSLARRYLLVSVPREPIWRLLNMARGSYLSSGGNTPGHVNHWSAGGFRHFVSAYATIVAARHPLPWTMALLRTRS